MSNVRLRMLNMRESSATEIQWIKGEKGMRRHQVVKMMMKIKEKVLGVQLSKIIDILCEE